MNFSTIRKLLLPAIIFNCFYITAAHAQTTSNYSLVDNLNPVTPTAFQFLKYDQLPVSEYTGIPNISIPIYEINEDGVKIPLDLTYHSSGFKVNEEASWVGLGWDMTVGSIVQQISDQDDYAAATHLQSDYVNSGTPQFFPYKYYWCQPPTGSGDNICLDPGCSALIPIDPVVIADGIEIYTDQYAPFQGDYGWHTGQNYEYYFNNHEVNFGFSIDSEPDIFTANFLGHSFKFMWDMHSHQIVVLDKKGYKVVRTGQSWQVFVPSGEEYDFAVKDSVQSTSTSSAITGAASTSDLMPSSYIWMLTKIITKNKKIITFGYNQTPVEPCYPTFTEKGIVSALTSSTYTSNTAQWASFCQASDVTNSAPNLAICPTQSSSYERYTYLSSISFPNGSVSFNLSSRNDIKGGLKLDSLKISTSTQAVKSWKFNYSYFNATAVGGNRFNITDTANFGTCPLYRLQLLSLQDNSGATYTFTYNSTQLPAKNSFATDYWGYYNGDTTNTTVIANATQFNKTGWQTNSDNHSANLTYTQAGILTKIQYPTGGTVNFTYALNQFNTYWVPDYTTNTNTISSGDGLRVQSIIWKDNLGNQLKQTNYTYNGGMASLPINFFRSYNYSVTPPQTLVVPNAYYLQKVYAVNETNMSGAFTANPFASFNGVGYSQVTKTDVDNSGNTNGKTVSNYYNQPDLVYNSITAIQQADPTLPAYKNPLDTADNGALKSELTYNKDNTLLKKTTNAYTNIFSPTYYGARIMGYASLVRFVFETSSPTDTYWENTKPQSMVCYYPIFDFESLPTQNVETDYFNADSVTNTTVITYDSYNQIASTTKTNSTYKENMSFAYPYTYAGTSSNYLALDSMVAHNRLTDIVNASKSTPNSSSTFIRHYQQLGSLYVASKDTDYEETSLGNPNLTTYDQYDPSNGNIEQYSQNTVPNAVLWDYNKEEVIAIAKNALFTNIAYTSFEADGTGRWKFTGTPMPDAAAPAGQKVYSLANGNIYRDSLNATLTYVVSYWSKSGAQTVSGSTTTKTGFTFNGYTYYEHTVPTPTSGTITVSGTGTIDELRLYPTTAQMTSYTYNPLVGISSEDNAGGKIAYYEYDYAMRLLDIRDQYKHILKAYCYNYAGQPTNCGVNITYSNTALSQSFTRNNCGSGYIGSSVAYTVAAGTYTSTMSLQDANNQAQEAGQANANNTGGCTLPPVITDIQYGGHGTGYTEIIFNSITGCTTTTINYKDLTTNTNYSDAGSCTSPRYETLIVGHNYQFTITCYSTAFPSGLTSAPYNYTPAD